MTTPDPLPVTVLFVDDDKGVLLSLTHLLQHEPYQILTATSGEEALEIVRNNREIGVVISDQIMGGMSGIEFLGKVWDLIPDALRIMLTGHGGSTVEHEALYKAGVFRYIAKPWNNDELIQTLRDTVNIYQLIRENRQSPYKQYPLASEKTDQHREMTLSPAV